MTNEEAIKIIKNSRDYKYSHYDSIDRTGKALDKAIEALKEQSLKTEKASDIQVDDEWMQENELEEIYKNKKMKLIDVDKFIEALDDERYMEMKQSVYGKQHKQIARGVEKAIDIVRKGGKE